MCMKCNARAGVNHWPESSITQNHTSRTLSSASGACLLAYHGHSPGVLRDRLSTHTKLKYAPCCRSWESGLSGARSRYITFLPRTATSLRTETRCQRGMQQTSVDVFVDPEQSGKQLPMSFPA